MDAQIYFLQAYKELVRNLPLKLFPTDDNREKFLTAIQERLDETIEREEEETDQ